MNLDNSRYSKFEICKEMFQAVEVIQNFDPGISSKYVSAIKDKRKLLLTGEGSSRLFPAKHLIYQNRILNSGVEISTEGATQALEYNLYDSVVFGASNSGKTKELIRLIHQLKSRNHQAVFGLTANKETPLEMLSDMATVLQCGPEKAVAATKSVVEQSLFYHSLHFNLLGVKMEGLASLAGMVRQALEYTIDPAIIQRLLEAPVIYFAGRNNGVAEEITLKTNEIARKRSGYLEGTYAVHGIEEALNPKDVVVIFDPFPDEEEKFKQALSDGVGVGVIAISSRPTLFKTLLIPDAGIYRNYVELAMGWNLLAEAGIELGLNLDKPARARKIGNEFTE